MRPEIESEILRQFDEPREARAPALEGGLGELRADVYADPVRFERERERLFTRAWIPAAPCASLARAGEVVTLELAGEPLVLTRDEQGVVRALSNVCAHRGAQIVRQPCAQLRTLRCPYHGFEYGLDGALLRRPAPESFANSAPRLRELECAPFGGWWWTRASRGGPTLEESLGAELIDELRNYPLHELELLCQREFEADFDWKVGVEAFLEPLHVPAIHSRSAHPLVDFRGMAARELGDHSRMALPFRVPSAYEPDGPLGELAHRSGVQSFAALNRAQRRAHLVYLLFPSLILMLFPNHLLALRFLPRTLGRCAVRWELRALAAHSESARAWLASLTPGYERLIAEDMENLPWIQRGLAGARSGPLLLSSYERRIGWFRAALERWLR